MKKLIRIKLIFTLLFLSVSSIVGAQNIFKWELKPELPSITDLESLKSTVKNMAENTSVWKLDEVQKGIYDPTDLKSWTAKYNVYQTSVPYLEQRIKLLNDILEYTKKGAAGLQKIVKELETQSLK